MPRFAVVHGPNLNLLGRREPDVYGSATLDEINAALHRDAADLGIAVDCFQSNHEGALVDRIQRCLDDADALIINPAGYTHTSVALRDAVLAVRSAVVVVEVHLSIPSGREPFRRKNLLSDVVHGRIEGFGADSYRLALRAASALIASRGD